jgi:hypothetical protein
MSLERLGEGRSHPQSNRDHVDCRGVPIVSSWRASTAASIETSGIRDTSLNMEGTNMKTRLVCLTAFALCLSLPVFSASAQEKTTTTFTGAELLKYAKVGIVEARAIALKASPGIITDEELEAEKGDSGLRYSFDIKQGKVVKEVGVDAKTGKVLENAKEGPNPGLNFKPARLGNCAAVTI